MKLLTSVQILRGTVSFGKRVFDKKTAKAREARLYIYFPTASAAGAPAPISVPHALGRMPTTFDVVALHRDPVAGAPGKIYTVHPFATSTRATFLCDTANTHAEIVLR